MQTMQTKAKVLIVPSGIETVATILATPIPSYVLIVPSGIETSGKWNI